MSAIDIEISEVGPRDGLQSITPIMPTAAKKQWISALAAAGVPEIEVGSFVPARVLPQLADTAELVTHARGIAGLAVAVLVSSGANPIEFVLGRVAKLVIAAVVQVDQ